MKLSKNRFFWVCRLTAMMLGISGVCGCDDKDSDDDIITLSNVIPNPVSVKLSGDIGTITYDFQAQPLPVEYAETLKAMINDCVISLTVMNNEGGVNYVLTNGTLVSSAPIAEGEYSPEAAADGTSLTVAFFNNFSGASIRVDGDYSAAVSVSANDFFATEEFGRSVTVTEQNK
jgi:hypothetical protein